jgi:alpha-tubulin suppressor-like RCC1 family protein
MRRRVIIALFMALAAPAAWAVVTVQAGAQAASAVGASHGGMTLTRSPGGSLLAWGKNHDGQLGDGILNSSFVPVPVKLPQGVRVVAVSAGAVFSLALTSDGRVLAWGKNNRGELGDGSTVSSPLPVWVKLPRGVKVTAIAAGAVNGLAVTSAGGVLAWGWDSFGQLGDGTRITSDTPVQVLLPRGVRVVAVSAGEQHCLALTSDGRVLAWGRNDSGELGTGDTRVRLVPAWVRLPGGTRVTAIASGMFHSLAVTSSGRVLAWGYNVFGQLGVALVGAQKSDLPVWAGLPRATRIVAVAAGGEHSLALTARGVLFAWGINYEGQLGDGRQGIGRHRPLPVKLPGGARVTAIAAGWGHSLALTSAGAVLAWGVDPTGTSTLPVPVSLPGGLVAVGLAPGDTAYHAIVIVRPAA